MPALASSPYPTTFEPPFWRLERPFTNVSGRTHATAKVTPLLEVGGNLLELQVQRYGEKRILAHTRRVKGTTDPIWVRWQVPPGQGRLRDALAAEGALGWTAVPAAILAEHAGDDSLSKLRVGHVSLLSGCSQPIPKRLCTTCA